MCFRLHKEFVTEKWKACDACHLYFPGVFELKLHREQTCPKIESDSETDTASEAEADSDFDSLKQKFGLKELRVRLSDIGSTSSTLPFPGLGRVRKNNSAPSRSQPLLVPGYKGVLKNKSLSKKYNLKKCSVNLSKNFLKEYHECSDCIGVFLPNRVSLRKHKSASHGQCGFPEWDGSSTPRNSKKRKFSDLDLDEDDLDDQDYLDNDDDNLAYVDDPDDLDYEGEGQPEILFEGNKKKKKQKQRIVEIDYDYFQTKTPKKDRTKTPKKIRTDSFESDEDYIVSSPNKKKTKTPKKVRTDFMFETNQTKTPKKVQTDYLFEYGRSDVSERNKNCEVLSKTSTNSRSNLSERIKNCEVRMSDDFLKSWQMCGECFVFLPSVQVKLIKQFEASQLWEMAYAIY